MTRLTDFLSDLFNDGRVQVSNEPCKGSDNGMLQMIDESARQNAPGEAPPLNADAALWAARLLCDACRFQVVREIPPDAVSSRLSENPPNPADPDVIFSVDLTFRHLPELFRMANASASDDALTIGLQKLGAAWPLSSVGMKGIANCNIDAIWSHPCLRRMYIDRILERKDESRLDDERIRIAIAAAVGEHEALKPWPAFNKEPVSP